MMISQITTGSSRCLFRAARNIKKGEEIFVSYVGNVEGLTKGERDAALIGWLAGTCGCTRCVREG